MRGSSASLPPSIAAASASIELTCAALQNSAIVFGPIPGSFISSRIPAPYLASSSSLAGIVPVRSSACRFAAMLLPIPGISSSFAVSSLHAARSTVVASTASAARR